MRDSVAMVLALLLALGAASLLALLLGTLLAAWLAMARFAARRALLVALGALAAAPPGLAAVLAQTLLPGWHADDRLAATAMLAAGAVLSAPLALLLTHGRLAAAWARHGRGLQSAGVSRWQALGPLLASQRGALAVALLAVLARGLGDLAAALALGVLPISVSPLLPLGAAVVLGGVAVWQSEGKKGKDVLF